MIETFIAILVILAALFVLYWFLVRPVLRQQAALSQFFAKADLIEAGWLARLRLGLSGMKSMLWARFLMIAGVILPGLDMLGFIDLTSILPPISVTEAWQITPTQYVPAILLPFIGWVNKKLREITTGPVGVPHPDAVAAIIPDAAPTEVAAKVDTITADVAEKAATAAAATTAPAGS